eukprot:1162069-Pelagomonas_calceolata.AAC.7
MNTWHILIWEAHGMMWIARMALVGTGTDVECAHGIDFDEGCSHGMTWIARMAPTAIGIDVERSHGIDVERSHGTNSNLASSCLEHGY